MSEKANRITLALVGVIGILVLAIVCVPFVGGESMIRGMGNGGNTIYTNGLADEVAELIVRSSAVPLITDDELRSTYLAIRDRAGGGDVNAAMVVFRVAEIQRAARDAE